MEFSQRNDAVGGGVHRFAVFCATLCVGNGRTSDAQPVIDRAQNDVRAAGAARGDAC
jgi:hypothetical protein